MSCRIIKVSDEVYKLIEKKADESNLTVPEFIENLIKNTKKKE